MRLEKQLKEYVKGDIYPFHMPGHKRRVFLTEESPFLYDITEIDGFDNLHDAQEILKEGMEEAAEIYHSRQSFYLVNGSSGGILAAIRASVKKGNKILVARNCHKSVYHALELNELVPVYIYPPFIKEAGIQGSIVVSDVEAAFNNNPEIKAAIITSPTYDGVTSDIKKIAQIVHAHNAVLIVDEAHGAHFRFGMSFPKSAMECDADLVIQSLHKTLPALTQTAILHRNSERVELSKLKHALSVYQTSSPSYVFMCSIEKSISYAVNAKEQFKIFEDMLFHFYKETKKLKNLYVWDPIKSDKIFDKDFSKIIIGCKNRKAGHFIYEKLLREYRIQPEMEALCYTVCLSTVCDEEEGFSRLISALFAMDEEFDSVLKEEELDDINYPFNKVMKLPCEMEEVQAVSVKLDKSAGFISKEYAYLYPPGIPIVVPGEKISEDTVRFIKKEQKAGLSLKGLQDAKGIKIQVAAPGELCDE